MAKDFLTDVTTNIGNLLSGVQSELTKFAPKDELTRRKFDALTSGELEVLRLKHGDAKINAWLAENMMGGY